MSINKLIHIYRKGECIKDIANNYNTTPYKIFLDNLISNYDYLEDYTPLVINIDTKCTEKEQIYCNEEKRGCHGCYYFK